MSLTRIAVLATYQDFTKLNQNIQNQCRDYYFDGDKIKCNSKSLCRTGKIVFHRISVPENLIGHIGVGNEFGSYFTCDGFEHNPNYQAIRAGLERLGVECCKDSLKSENI